jgi:hypothetical protein
LLAESGANEVVSDFMELGRRIEALMQAKAPA